MRRIILATFNGPEALGFERGKFYPLLVESDPSWIRRKLKGWRKEHRVIIALPTEVRYLDWDTFWGHWTEKRFA